MQRVKRVISKFFNPSFLFSANEDNDQSTGQKRKLPSTNDGNNTVSPSSSLDDPERNDNVLTTRLPFHRSVIGTGVSRSSTNHVTTSALESYDQQTKRRRLEDDSNFLPDSRSTDSNLSQRPSHDSRLSMTTVNNLPNNNPSSSPLFSTPSRKPADTTNRESEDYAPQYLLASSLTTRVNPVSSRYQPYLNTLSNPTADRVNRSSYQFTDSFSSISFRRVPYIERLRHKTLRDCVRLHEKNEGKPIVPSNGSTSTNNQKPSSVDIGVQYDIEPTKDLSESDSKKREHSSDTAAEQKTPPEKLVVEKDTPIQTESSIIIERRAQTDIADISKPTLLGTVTPFSWPAFARAQQEYSNKNPTKCVVQPTSTNTTTGTTAAPILFQSPFNFSIRPSVSDGNSALNSFISANPSTALPTFSSSIAINSKADTTPPEKTTTISSSMLSPSTTYTQTLHSTQPLFGAIGSFPLRMTTTGSNPLIGVSSPTVTNIRPFGSSSSAMGVESVGFQSLPMLNPFASLSSVNSTAVSNPVSSTINNTLGTHSFVTTPFSSIPPFQFKGSTNNTSALPFGSPNAPSLFSLTPSSTSTLTSTSIQSTPITPQFTFGNQPFQASSETSSQ